VGINCLEDVHVEDGKCCAFMIKAAHGIAGRELMYFI
jgi:hypothetical protein